MAGNQDRETWPKPIGKGNRWVLYRTTPTPTPTPIPIPNPNLYPNPNPIPNPNPNFNPNPNPIGKGNRRGRIGSHRPWL